MCFIYKQKRHRLMVRTEPSRLTVNSECVLWNGNPVDHCCLMFGNSNKEHCNTTENTTVVFKKSR